MKQGKTKLSFANSALSDHCVTNIKRLRPYVSSVVVCFDSAVPEHLLTQVLSGIQKSGCDYKTLKVARGEKNKTIEHAAQLANKLLRAKVDRSSLVIAVGGGTTSDVVGFSASMVMRGVRWACLPTTLLSMVDAGIGGKTGVNAGGAKNMLGAFHFPEFIHIDFRWLKSLPVREFSSGLGELQKTALLAGGQLLNLCLAASPSQLRKPCTQLQQIIKMAAKFKAKVVAGDPTETDMRQILNLGHTFGHPLELSERSHLTHGEAVSYGIRCAVSHSVELGICDEKLVKLNDKLQQKMRLEYVNELPLPTASTLRQVLARDKKSKGGELTLVLLEKAGRPMLRGGYSAAAVAKIVIANRLA